MARRRKPISLPAPFLRRLSVLEDVLEARSGYPFTLPWLSAEFELEFETPVTILVGENGAGKSTLIEAVASLSGYDESGGGKGYRAVDHSGAKDRSGAELADALRAGWLPKVTDGWFFRSESFFSVARYLDEAGSPSADFLSMSHGEGFLRFFEERLSRQGIYFMDEPESALSPRRQLELLRILNRISESEVSQIVMATHSPILMALPGATLLEVTKSGFAPVDLMQTRHFRLYQDFTVDPDAFIAEALADETDSQF
ncbi:AAA family ATPase [Aestuariibius insulae]|uniref:AAA family ATPase n=1 Tax=Aestuariibius insulae TaxID=2058287 RepID=UPI00345EBEBD